MKKTGIVLAYNTLGYFPIYGYFPKDGFTFRHYIWKMP